MQRHSFNALNSTFFVDSEYQFVKELGQGAYGCVVAAKHRRTGEGCAIKKITNINTKVCGRSLGILLALPFTLPFRLTILPLSRGSSRRDVCARSSGHFIISLFWAFLLTPVIDVY